MNNYKVSRKEDLPFIFQLLEAENEVASSITLLENDINQINHQKKHLNVAFHNQSHLLRNIIFSVVFATIITVFFKINFFGSLLVGLVGFTAYDFYKKNTIKKRMDDIDLQVDTIFSKRNAIQNQLYNLVEENHTYTSQIPQKFRDTNSIVRLFNYLYYGQADNLKEAYHLLDSEYKHQEHMGILKKHSNLLEENNQIAYQQLSHIQGLTSLQEQQLTAMRELSDTARNMNITLEQTGKRVQGLEERFVPKYKRKR